MTNRLSALIKQYLPTMTQACIALSLIVMPVWWKIPHAPAPFTSTYVLGFPLTWFIIITTLLGFVNSLAHRHRPTRLQWLWLCLWFCLITWTSASQHWAFMADRPALVHNATLQTLIVASFAIVISLQNLNLRWMLGALLLGCLLYGTIGALQVARQASIGLPGEFYLNPALSGISVIEASGVRWLRPYGLLPHPNIWAGFIVGATLGAFWAYWRGWRWALLLCAFGIWLLLLSFSRGAWVGFAVTLALMFPLWMRRYGTRPLRVLLPVTLALTLTFVTLYAPLIFARGGVGQENTEMRSLADRIVYTRIAHEAIQTHPLTGIGASHFPWYASNYLYHRTNYDLRGDNVHTVPLLIFAELGVVGFGLWLGIIVIPLGQGMRATWRGEGDPSPYVGVALAWMLIGIVDHYPWTLIMTQAYWVVMLAGALGRPRPTSA